MPRTFLDIIGEDIIGAISKIGTIRVHQLKNGEWHAYIVAEGDPQESTYSKGAREVYVKRFMSERHIGVVKDDNGGVITGATRKELIKKVKSDPPVWWIEFDILWTRT
jgi:hypothetical protein